MVRETTKTEPARCEDCGDLFKRAHGPVKLCPSCRYNIRRMRMLESSRKQYAKNKRKNKKI
jgi:rRNA maturation endonuclease Nob1